MQLHRTYDACDIARNLQLTMRKIKGVFAFQQTLPSGLKWVSFGSVAR